MSYKLKIGQEAFEPVEGPFAGRKFVPGKTYGEIPPEEARRFEEIRAAAKPKPVGAPAPAPAAAKEKEKPAKAETKKTASPAAPASEMRR
jgi:hypothetical protein